MLETEQMAVGSEAGNPDAIQVAVRVRPILDREAELKGPSESWRAIPHAAQVVRLGRPSAGAGGAATGPAAFYFDYVFGKESSNEDVYLQVARPLVEGSLNGYNGTVFAYGQTSSGKTHTMWGTDLDPGVMRRAVQDLFDSVRAAPHREFLIRVSYLEIYNETIRDLLHPQPATTNIRVLEDSDGRIYTDAREEIVTHPEQVYELLLNGETKRMTGATDMNERSSRSHTILTLVIESRERTSEDDVSEAESSGQRVDSCSAVRTATLTLVDLAGSERQKDAKSEGLRLKEGGFINKSLLTLGTVINKLSEGNHAHIPYRDSKLTRMLQNSLGGNSRTAVICAITPAAAHAEETLSTLKFATRAKDVQNRAQQNEVLDDRALLKRYQKEIAALRTQLSKLQQGEADGPKTSAEAVRALEQNAAEAERERELIKSQLEEAESKRRLYEEKLEHLTRLILNSPAPTSRARTKSRISLAASSTEPNEHDEAMSPQPPRQEPRTPPASEPALDQKLAKILRTSRRRTIGGSVADIAHSSGCGPLTPYEASLVEQVRVLMERYMALSAARSREQSASLKAIRQERLHSQHLQQNLDRLESQGRHRTCAEIANEAIHQAALLAVDTRLVQIRKSMKAERFRVHQLQREVEQVRQACAEKQSRLETLERELTEARSELDELRQRERAGFTQSQARTFDHLRNRVSDLEAKLRSQLALRQQVESSRSTTERELRKLERQNRALEKEIAKMRDQRERIEHTKLSVAQAERLRTASEQTQQQLQIERDALQQQLSTLEQEHATLVAERNALLEYRESHKQAREELELAQQRIAELARAADASDWQQRCQSLSDELDAAKTRITTLETQVESSAKELTSLLDQATDAHLQLEAVRSQARASERMQKQLAAQLREELDAMRTAHENESAEWKRLRLDEEAQRKELNTQIAGQERMLDSERHERARLESRTAKLLQESAKHIQEKQQLLETIHTRDRRIHELEDRLRDCVEGGGRYARLCKLVEKRETELGRVRETLRRLEERLVAEGRASEFCDLQAAAQRDADLASLEKQVARHKMQEERAQQERQRLLAENHKLRDLVKQKDRQLLGMQARLKTYEAEALASPCNNSGQSTKVSFQDANTEPIALEDKENRELVPGADTNGTHSST
jgi:centromeric protein E